MNRRIFLKTFALAGIGLAMKPVKSFAALANDDEKPGASVDLIAVMGAEPDQMFKKAIEEFGGMKRFVKTGQKVCIKPNIGWDRVPERAANTNPLLIAEIIRQCVDAGASEVTVFDHTCDDWVKCYQNSGIEAEAKAAGAKMLPGNQESYYKQVELPQGKILKEAKIHQAILDSDVWINVPVLKNHGGSGLTISMKNYMGIVWDRRVFHMKGLQQCIADICTLDKKPALNVVDAYRVMQTNGPQGRSETDVVLSKALFLSQDIVAVDTAATSFFNQIRSMPMDVVKHLGLGEEMGLGSTDLSKLNIKRIRL